MRRIPVSDISKARDVVDWSTYQPAPQGHGGITTIRFRSHRVLYIIDLPGDHRVEAYAP